LNCEQISDTRRKILKTSIFDKIKINNIINAIAGLQPNAMHGANILYPFGRELNISLTNENQFLKHNWYIAFFANYITISQPAGLDKLNFSVNLIGVLNFRNENSKRFSYAG
jgi:uncharacterized protein YhhL (DUF1145 family)